MIYSNEREREKKRVGASWKEGEDRKKTTGYFGQKMLKMDGMLTAFGFEGYV